MKLRNLLRTLRNFALGVLVAVAPLPVREASADPTLPSPDTRMLSANPSTGALTWPTASTFRSANGLAIGTDVQAYDSDLAAIAALTTTSFGRGLLDDADAAAARLTLSLGSIATQASSSVSITGGSITGITDLAIADGGTGASSAPVALDNLGLEGELYVGAFMKSFTDERLVIAVSRDGQSWTLLNNGDAVYARPGYVVGSAENVVRDPSIYYQASTGWFYVAHTSGDYGHSGYFSVIRSKDLITWEAVKDVNVGAVGAETVWGPCIYAAENGDITVFFTANSTPGPLKIYRMSPVSNTDWSGSWTAAALVDMPNANDETYNEVFVFRTAAGALRMLINNGALNYYEVLSASAIDGAWTLVDELGEATVREGVFALEKPEGGFRVYFTYSGGSPNYYQWKDTTDWATYTALNPVLRSPAISFENGDATLVRSGLSAAFGGTMLTGTMARQNKDAVAITGGTLSGISSLATTGAVNVTGGGVRVPYHAGFAGGGLIWKKLDGTDAAIIGFGDDNNFYWKFPSNSVGLSIYNGAGNAEIANISNGGNFQHDGTLTTGGTASIGGTTTVSGQLRVNADNGWASGGIRFYDGAPGSASAFIGCFTDGQFAARMGVNGGGLVFYNGAGNTLVARITDAGVLQASGIKVGGNDGASGTSVAYMVSGTATLDFGNLTAGAEETLTITATGATTTNTPVVTLGWAAALEDGILVKQAWVSSANTISVRVRNVTAGDINPAAVVCRGLATGF